MKRRSFALVILMAGCAGSELAGRSRDVRATIATARQGGAYECAPRELALAETRVEFAERERDLGEYFRAREHLAVADINARQAVRLAALGRCDAGPRVAGDTDADGVADATDRCPGEAEDRDGFEDADGCPDPDNDQDGLVDARDRCPKDAEDVDGFRDEDGCPDPDNDDDGVTDATDRCPRDREDRDGFEDTDGCPDPDNDKDGYADGADRCPTEAGPAGGDGCPVRFRHISVTAERIELGQQIFFATSTATIMARSHALLSEIVAVLKTRQTMRVRVEGHTDSVGPRPRNIRLSQARADSVRGYLVARGIDGGRLEAKGFGPDQPIETNKTAAGRDRNRRVDFVITQP